ncbi:hypothetical protein, partial [Sinorhizobium meliloti]
KTNSEKIGYRPRGRKPGKRTDFTNDPAVIARRRAVCSSPFLIADACISFSNARSRLLRSPANSVGVDRRSIVN